MRRLTTRIVLLPRRPCRGGAGERARAGPDRRQRGPQRPALAVRHLRRRQRAARQEGPLPRRRRAPLRRPHRARPVPRPRHAGVGEAGPHDRQARRHVHRPLEGPPHRPVPHARARRRRGADRLGVARAPAHRLPPCHRHLVRPRLLRQQDRLRARDDRGARRRRPPQPAVRDERRRALRVADARGPRRRPRPVQRRGEVGPHRRGRAAARLHAHGSHRRDPPRAAPLRRPSSRSSGW